MATAAARYGQGVPVPPPGPAGPPDPVPDAGPAAAPWTRPGRYRHRNGIVLATAAVQVFGTRIAAGHQPSGARALDLLGYALLVGGPVLLLYRRRHRVPVLVAVALCTLGYYLLGYPYGPGFVALLVAAGGAIHAGARRAAWLVMGLSYLAFVATRWLAVNVTWLPRGRPALGEAVAVAAWTLVTLAVAEAVRNRASALAEIGRTRAEQARAQAEQRRRQAADERVRIARELHDVLGHHLSLINVQAGVGLHLMDEHPEQARTALAAIRTASAEALREVRSVLGILRPEDEDAPRAPAPSLASLPDLVAGTAAGLVVTGTRRDLPAEVDRAGYRIVQEALTNVRRHAGTGATAQVSVDYAERALTVRVCDDGTGPAPGADIDAGNGLAGMRARVDALGGTLRAGPGPGGGFEVRAVLPTGGGAP